MRPNSSSTTVQGGAEEWAEADRPLARDGRSLQRGNLRWFGVRLAAARRRAFAARSAHDAGAIAVGRALSRACRGAAADRRPGADQADARHRRADPCSSRWWRRRSRRKCWCAPRAIRRMDFAASAPASRARRDGDASRIISIGPMTRPACCCRSKPGRGSKISKPSRRSRASTAIFLGAADLSASLGHIGQPQHPEVVAAMEKAIAAILAERQGARPARDRRRRSPSAYLAQGAHFVAVGVDALLLVQATQALARRFMASAPPESRGSSY